MSKPAGQMKHESWAPHAREIVQCLRWLGNAHRRRFPGSESDELVDRLERTIVVVERDVGAK